MKRKALIVVDMQNDFIDGALGTPEAQAIVDYVARKIRAFDGDCILVTQDTHDSDYLHTQEGRWLPVEHCIRGTDGWYLNTTVENRLADKALNGMRIDVIEKSAFGSTEIIDKLRAWDFDNQRRFEAEVTLIGLCTDICVISNALLIKSFFPEVFVTVDARCCAGVTPQSHNTALEAMQACQINIENWG